MSDFKPILFKTDTQWQAIRNLADELSLERGSKVSLATTVSEAIKFYTDNRIKAGTPGGEVRGNAADIQAQSKGVITE